MHWIVIPFRGVESAKSRLSACLSDEARRQVAIALFQHVLNVACRVAGPRHVLVVTPSATAVKTARRASAAVLPEAVTGHNEAIEQACAHLRGRGASTAAIVAADLPLLKPSNIEALMRSARSGTIAIAPDREGLGTNAIALPLAVPFRFQFGAGSRHEH
jgi:2-phospho-L-lactate/phosphoenolpyruvate guanylyltransferase